MASAKQPTRGRPQQRKPKKYEPMKSQDVTIPRGGGNVITANVEYNGATGATDLVVYVLSVADNTSTTYRFPIISGEVTRLAVNINALLTRLAEQKMYEVSDDYKRSKGE